MFQLVKKACDFLHDKINTLTAFAFVGVSTLTSIAFGQGTTIEVVPPDIEFGTVAEDLVSALTSVAAAGIGIALSIWALIMVARVFKRSAS
jgi:hypothetical protein